MVQGRIIKRLLGQPATDSSPEQGVAFEQRVDASFLRPSSSQHASLDVASPLSCLDKSPTGSYAVIAGEGVFKTIKVDGSTITEEVDLRAATSTQGSTHDSTLSAFNDQLNIKAVKWSHGELDTTIVTASANGRVTLYDLNRIGSGLEIGRIREHARQVHKLAINPFRGNWLLSASQDGTARLFDIRSAAMGRNGQTFNSWSVFRCNADAVRDIAWSPTEGFNFACSTASGTILYWDTRKPTAPLLRISNAHDSACLSISWHPDGDHLISGGLDQQCLIWNLSEKVEKRHKAKYTIAAPAPVSIVAWRPGSWSFAAQAKRAAQIVMVYDGSNPMKIQNSTVHVWDVARPHLPFKEITDLQTSPKGLLWHESDLLWTVGKDGKFTQTDVAFAPKVIDRRSLSTFDFSPSGEVLMLLEERRGAPRPRPPVSTPISADMPARPTNPEIQSQSPNTGQLGISRSDSEEDISGSFLGPRPRSKKQAQRHGTRSAHSVSSTPPSIYSSDGRVMKLEEAVKYTGPYKPQQIMATGQAPSATRREVYEYLSSRYLLGLAREARSFEVAVSSSPSVSDRLCALFEHFAKSAENVGQFRLAQTWRVLAYTMGLLLTRRAEYHFKARMARQDKEKAEHKIQQQKVLIDNQQEAEQYHHNDMTPLKLDRTISPFQGLTHPARKSILAEEIESTSNMTTPVARPIRDSMIYETTTSAPISTIDNDILVLPPAARSSVENGRGIAQQSRKDVDASPDLEGYDFYDMATLSTPAIDIAPPQRKAPFRLDLHLRDQGDHPRGGPLARHDSNESFQMFSSSGDSQSRKFPSPSESGGHASLPTVTHRSVIYEDSNWASSATSSGSRPVQSFEDNNSINRNASPEARSPEMSGLLPTMRIQNTSPEKTSGFQSANAEKGMMSCKDSVCDTQKGYPGILECDYLPLPSDPPFLPGPIEPHLLIQRSIEFESQTGSLNASIMVLVLKNLLLPGTLDDLQSSAILQQFHSRLDGMMLFTEAALLRKLCYPAYPSVCNQGRPKIIGSMGYYCTTCEKPVQEGNLALGQRLQKCYRCNTYFDGCAVCTLWEAPPSLEVSDWEQISATNGARDGIAKNALINPASPAASLWWWCQGCGHGGHTACMRSWHSSDGNDFSDGCCPLEGCLHPCLPGKWRSTLYAHRSVAKSEELSKLVKDSTRGGPKGLRVGGVKRDKTEVGESKAVESVRGTLTGSGTGANAGERERKSVKVIAPGDN